LWVLYCDKNNLIACLTCSNPPQTRKSLFKMIGALSQAHARSDLALLLQSQPKM
jgi:hypothetical protein